MAAALLRAQGHEVVGATMKLWGGPSDSGCCSVADVEDARRVAQQLHIDHHVFNFTAEFDRKVVAPYVEAHAQALTPNPCVACNTYLKFDRFLVRGLELGFDAIATGHHARVTLGPGLSGASQRRLQRGADPAKDQSYVLYMLGQSQLERLLLPIGHMAKEEVRRVAADLGLRTAAKPDSQDVCFISRHGGREAFLGQRIALGPGRLVSTDGEEVGQVEALELVTVGQRRGLGFLPRSRPDRRFVLSVDQAARTATVGTLDELLTREVEAGAMTWSAGGPPDRGAPLLAQFSAHGQAYPASWDGGESEGSIALEAPVRRVAPGQAVVLYRPGASPSQDTVEGGGTAK